MKSNAQLVPISTINSDPVKLRAVDQEHVEAIRQSFEKKGQQQPIRIRPTESGPVVVFGEHRLAAARLLASAGKTIKGLPEGHISAIVEEIDEYEALELKITENAHRNPFVDVWEEGKVMKKLLMEKYHGNLDAMSDSIGKTNTYIKDRTRVYDCLDPRIRKYIGIRGGLSAANVITLAKYDDKQVQYALAERIVANKDIQSKSAWVGGGYGAPSPGAYKAKVELECICPVPGCGNIHSRPKISVPVEAEVPDIKARDE